MTNTTFDSVENQAYDIVICGGGSAGCVLATRLSEIPDLEILLLEAGGNHNDDPRVRIPALFGQAIGDENLDWNYKTIPQIHLDSKQVLQPRGKGLGGSSLINVMSLVYPSKVGFDAWAEMGNEGWDWNSMLPYLKKFQTIHWPKNEQVIRDLNLSYIDKEAQRTDGPIQASYMQVVNPLHKAWVDTFQTMGYETKLDTLSGKSVGGYQIVSAVDPAKHERSHAGAAYLDMARFRPNLKIVTDAVVDKILLSNEEYPRARGVFAQVCSTNYTFHARKEVLVCAGSYDSPGILERSGVGNPDILQQLGVKCSVKNVHVGENLQDHIMCGVSFELVDGLETFDNFRDPAYVEAAMEQYQTSRTGPLTVTNPSFAYMPLTDRDNANRFLDVSDLLKKHLPSTSIDQATNMADDFDEAFVTKVLLSQHEASANLCTTLGQAHLPNETMAAILATTNPGNYISLWTALCHPLSRGSVHCLDANPLSQPVINPNYFSHPLDLEIMSRHVQFFDCIISTEPMKSIIKEGGVRIPLNAKFDTLEQTRELSRNSCMSNYHPAGSCAMKPQHKKGVVDDKLRVYGVKGLRICDASIMPIIPRGNILSSVYAIAEKAADMVKEDLAQPTT